MGSLPEIQISQAKAGDTGIFKGVTGGEEIEVPYAEHPVVYYKYNLQEEIVTVQNGQRRRRWRPVRSGESQVPFTLEGEGASVMIDPTKYSVQTKEIYNGRAVGLNKNMWKAIQFITQGQLRPDLMEKKLKLTLDGVPAGVEASAVGRVEDTGAGLAVTRGDDVGGFYLTQNVSEMMKKEKTLQWVFLGGAIVLAVIGIGAIISAVV